MLKIIKRLNSTVVILAITLPVTPRCGERWWQTQRINKCRLLSDLEPIKADQQNLQWLMLVISSKGRSPTTAQLVRSEPAD